MFGELLQNHNTAFGGWAVLAKRRKRKKREVRGEVREEREGRKNGDGSKLPSSGPDKSGLGMCSCVLYVV